MKKQAEVGVAGAEALGQMGANGAGDINLGGGGDGFNMAAMMASMAVGGAVGQNIAGSMNNIMQGINQPVQSGITPPPIPTSVYNVAVNGQATGPFDINILKQMAIAAQFKASSLVWKPEMESWLRADSVDELKDLFKNVMPPIRQQKINEEERSMKCLKCGAELSEDTKFCSYCGAKVEAQTEIPPIPPEVEEADEPKTEEKYTYQNNTVYNALSHQNLQAMLIRLKPNFLAFGAN